LTLIALAPLLALGCKKESAPGDAGASASASASASRIDLAAVLGDASVPLTPEMDEAILLSLDKCSLKECKPFDFGIQTSCPAWNNYVSTIARKREGGKTTGVPPYLLKHLHHESAAVRFHAAFALGGQRALPDDAQAQAAMIDAARKEQNPNVRAEILTALGPIHAKNDAIKSLLLENSDNPGECVRMMALWPFLKKEGKGVPGTFDRVAEKLDSDPSPMVRRYLCSSLYGSENEKAIPLLQKYLDAKDTPEEVFTGCFQGAIEAWVGVPYPENPNQKAYEMSLKVLEASPRTEARPPWVQIRTLKWAKSDFPPGEHQGPAWYAKVKPWYKKERLQSALVALVSDPKAHHLAREEAIGVLGEIGTPKSTLTQLAAKLASLKGDDASVKAKLDGVLGQH
jgi:hypothetical protein